MTVFQFSNTKKVSIGRWEYDVKLDSPLKSNRFRFVLLKARVSMYKSLRILQPPSNRFTNWSALLLESHDPLKCFYSHLCDASNDLMD